jgi:hypothetical protein
MIGTLLRTIDRFTLLLLATVAFASLLPARAQFAAIVDVVADVCSSSPCSSFTAPSSSAMR